MSLRTQVFARSEDVVFTEFDSGIKAIDISNSDQDQVIEVTGLASKMFLSFDGKSTLDDILTKLEVSFEENEEDISKLIKFLQNYSFIY